MSRYLEVPQEKVGERLDTLIRLAHEGARIVIKKDGIAQAYIQPANPNMSEATLLALRSIPRTELRQRANARLDGRGPQVKLVLDASVALSGLYTRRGARGDGCPASAGIHRQLRDTRACPLAYRRCQCACLERAGQLASAKIAKFVRQMDRLALLADTPPTAERATAIHKLAQNHGLTRMTPPMSN